MQLYFFYFFAIILILASCAVVLARNPLYNVLSLVVSILALSSIFILLEAFFVAIILIMVYAGAVLIFFLFTVMCLNLNAPTFSSQQQRRFKLFGLSAGLLMVSTIIIGIKSFTIAQTMGPTSIRGNIETIGQVLFTDYLLPFELTSLLLLIAIFGIVSLAQGAFSQEKEIQS